MKYEYKIYNLEFHAANIIGGVYYYGVVTSKSTCTKKLIIIK